MRSVDDLKAPPSDDTTRRTSPAAPRASEVDGFALFGGPMVFDRPRSTSNILTPDIEAFLDYSKIFYDAGQFTNNGPVARLLETRLAAFHDTEHCVLFSSGFWAIVLAMRCVARPGKTEVIVPSLTYRRMPDIIAWAGLTPRYCDVDAESLAMTPEAVEACINADTAVILGTHPIVNCCDAAGLEAVAAAHGVPILFDSVESVHERVEEGRIGTFGKAECFSLHACKLLNGFGGGYLTSNDGELVAKVKAMRTFGYFGQDNVTIADGLNAKLNEMHAALCLASLDGIEAQVEANRQRHDAYDRLLAPLDGIELVRHEPRFRPGYKNIVAKLTDDWPLSRDLTIRLLNAENILARPHYAPPLHQVTRRYPHHEGNLTVTERQADRFINLPCGQQVSTDDVALIVDCLTRIARASPEIRQRLA